MFAITLKDGSKVEYDSPIKASEIIKNISEGLLRAAVAVSVNGELVDTSTVIDKDCDFTVITLKDAEGLNVYRHTVSHVLAQAIKAVYPTSKLAIGPTIENGFYYDVEFTTPIVLEDLKKIEKEMQDIIKADFPIERFTLTKKEAVKLMKNFSEPYKVQLIEEIPDGEEISFYKQGNFIDLCRGPHLPSTGKIKAFKLTAITGAYWKGKSENKMLTRIYGTAFENKTALEDYLKRLEEAKQRDHNKLGRDLEYFTTVDEIGQGLPCMLPKGAKVIQILQRFVEDEEEKRGYQLTMTPLMAKSDFYKISGHWDHYKEGMFVLGDEKKDKEVFALRPMTCPFQFQSYLNRPKSYKDLPVRLNETSTLFRNEDSGEMHGLIRVRQFTISEGHLACRPDQLEEEFKGCLDLAIFMLKAVGLDEDVTYRFSKWDKNNKKKYIGTVKEWEAVQSTMRTILDDLGVKYTESDGEAAFYGPKLDIQVKNVHGKEDTLITIQIDFQLAKRFNMVYTDADGEKKYPYVIHRTSIGCYQRTLALLIEKYAGALPLWLAPTQVKLLSVTDRTADYAKSLAKELSDLGIRAEVDVRNEKIGYKIREAQLSKVPYMFILGDKELENNTISVRSRFQGDLGVLSKDDIFAKLVMEDKTKKIYK
ncbi:MAG: threonine--tRNA ligase [Clostridia bacterium]|nr:threonine--tRNA ligase [Clostridia bacterium]